MVKLDLAALDRDAARHPRAVTPQMRWNLTHIGPECEVTLRYKNGEVVHWSRARIVEFRHEDSDWYRSDWVTLELVDPRADAIARFDYAADGEMVE